MKRLTRFLFPPLDHDYSALALRPVLLSGMVTPVVDGDGGVNLAMTTDNPSGLLSAVDPWQRMAVGDRVEFFWDTHLVDTREVEPEELDKRLYFYVPAQRVVPDWGESVFYRLTRQGSSTAEDSVPLRVRVKLDPPAGTDKEPHKPGHSELAAPGLPQDVIDNGVDARWAERGVPAEIVAYPGRAAQDTIELQWGAASLTHRVTASEAAGSAPIIITVDQATILAGGDAPNLLVHYQVFDEVWNFSTAWSQQTRVKVEAGAHNLKAPIIREAFNSVIDLEQLGVNDVTVQVEVRELPFELNDKITMTWTGTTRSGATVVHIETATITNIPSILPLLVPNAKVRAIVDGRAQASYVLTKANGAPPQSSKRAAARVTGKIALPMPIVYEAVGDTLDPTLERAHVEIPAYPDMASGDLIDLIWLGTRQNGTPYLYEAQHIVTGNEVDKAVYLAVMDEHIALLANGTLDVSYRVSNDALGPFDVRASDHLNLFVGQRRAELPAPTVKEAVDDVLDPEQVPHYATLQVPYTGTVVGDILTWYWLGEPPDGSASDWVPITRVIAGKPVPFNIPRALIEPNINNLVKVFYSLKLASTGKYQYSAVLDLTIGKLIGHLPAPDVLEAEGTTLDPLRAENGATVRVRYDSMDPQDVISLVWIGSPGEGSPADQQKPGNDSGQVDFLVPAAVIGADIARQVVVTYRVKRLVTEKQSEVLLLTIKPIADERLPTPQITQADPRTRILNLATFAANATTTVGKWPFIALGQRVWLRLEGSTETGAPYSITLLDGRALTSAEVGSGLSETVLRTELEKLGQDTRLTVVCKVAFNGINEESSALPLPSSVYEFKLHHDWVTPVIVTVTDSKGEVPEGATTFDTDLKLGGTGTIDTQLELLDGTTQLKTTRTDADGQWTVDLTGQRPKGYSITAKALDDSGLVSQPRTYQVLANLTPTIDQVLDARGPVSNGGTTVETSVTLSGKASPDQQIELFDGTNSLGKATTDALGAWTRPLSGLAIASHPFKAVALYGTEPESTVWTIVVAAAVTPTISSIRGASGNEIPVSGFTVDTSVTLTGTANANLEVEIFDGATLKGTVTTNASGIWTLPLDGLTVAAHDIKAKAVYGNRPESAVRRFTVVAVVTPAITKVVDPKNSSVANGGSTYANTVTATGQASINQRVELFAGAVSQGIATANASGTWTRAASGLRVGTHPLTAKGLYGNNPVSAAWTIIVRAATTPSITSVRDSRGEVAHGGSTTDRSVTARGKAAANEQVQVLDGATPKGNAPVNSSGDWSLLVTPLALGQHSLKAVAQYGDQPSSTVRSFQVRSPVPDFAMDTSPVALNGRVYIDYGGLEPLPWPSGTTASRTPRSGVPPYTYSSSNSNVVRVNSSGNIYSRGNGTASITIQDSQNRRGSYSVTVSNVTEFRGFSGGNYSQARNAVGGAGFRVPSQDELRIIYSFYGGRNAGWGNNNYWSSTAGGIFNTQWCCNVVTGSTTRLSVIVHALIIGCR